MLAQNVHDFELPNFWAVFYGLSLFPIFFDCWWTLDEVDRCVVTIITWTRSPAISTKFRQYKKGAAPSFFLLILYSWNFTSIITTIHETADKLQYLCCLLYRPPVLYGLNEQKIESLAEEGEDLPARVPRLQIWPNSPSTSLPPMPSLKLIYRLIRTSWGGNWPLVIMIMSRLGEFRW